MQTISRGHCREGKESNSRLGWYGNISGDDDSQSEELWNEEIRHGGRVIMMKEIWLQKLWSKEIRGRLYQRRLA